MTLTFSWGDEFCNLFHSQSPGIRLLYREIIRGPFVHDAGYLCTNLILCFSWETVGRQFPQIPGIIQLMKVSRALHLYKWEPRLSPFTLMEQVPGRGSRARGISLFWTQTVRWNLSVGGGEAPINLLFPPNCEPFHTRQLPTLERLFNGFQNLWR